MLASGGGEAARAQAEALEAAQRIGEDNIGHRMLRGMGWREGEGLGAAASGIAAPLAAGAAKAAQDKIGLGAAVRTGFRIYSSGWKLGCCGQRAWAPSVKS